jgi:DNA-binding response OmpR family regulator
MTRPRVLLVDDDEDVRHMTRVSLGFEGFDVTEAENGEEGLAEMRADTPAAVVLDVMMPGLDGLGVLRLMRDDNVLRDVPVVVLTAKAGLAAEQAGWDAGATAYLTKPFTGTALAATLRRMLDGTAGSGRARHDMAQRFAAAAEGPRADA